MDIIETSRSFSYDKDLRLFEIIKFLKFLEHEETSENNRNSIFLPVPVWNILYFFLLLTSSYRTLSTYK